MIKKKKNASPKRDQYIVVLEDVRSHIKVFGEAQSDFRNQLDKVNKKLDSHTEMIGDLAVDMETVKGDVKTLKSDMKMVKGDIKIMKEDVVALKDDVKVLKDDMIVVKSDIKTVKGDIVELKDGMVVVKSDLQIIKTDVEPRVAKLETMGSSRR